MPSLVCTEAGSEWRVVGEVDRPELGSSAPQVQIHEVGEEREPVVSRVRCNHRREIEVGQHIAESDRCIGGHRAAERGRQAEVAVALMFAIHPYGATLKVQPDGPTTCCPALIGCCACASGTAQPVISPAQRPIMTMRSNIKRPLT